MRLSDSFVKQDIEDTQFLISTDSERFSGLLRSNKTAAAIVELLKENTSEEAIVSAMCERYDAPEEVIRSDVRRILDTLRVAHALEE